jgi:hypothetical protein
MVAIPKTYVPSEFLGKDGKHITQGIEITTNPTTGEKRIADKGQAVGKTKEMLKSIGSMNPETLEGILLWYDTTTGVVDGTTNKYDERYKQNLVEKIQANPEYVDKAISAYAEEFVSLYEKTLPQERKTAKPKAEEKPTQAELNTKEILSNAKDMGNGKYEVNVDGREIKVDVEMTTMGADGIPKKENVKTEIHSFEIGKKDEDHVVYYIDRAGEKKEWARGIKAKNFIRNKLKGSEIDKLTGGGQSAAPKANSKPKEQDEFSEFKRK